MHALMAERSDVERLAEAAHLSVQQFSRAFIAARRMTPAKTIERLRAEVAHARAEEGRETLETIPQVGFADPERMRQSFIRVFRQTPQAMRRLARTAETAD
jgi:transcriptional regulator GlxA family with amidase domain